MTDSCFKGFSNDAKPLYTLGNLAQTSGSVSSVITVEGQRTDQLPAAMGGYPVRARVTGSDSLDLDEGSGYTTGTLTIPRRSSSGGGGSASGSSTTTETTANPDGSISCEQLATMLWRYAGSRAVEGSLEGFSDAGSVNDYAADAMRWAVSTGIIGGRATALWLPRATPPAPRLPPGSYVLWRT